MCPLFCSGYYTVYLYISAYYIYIITLERDIKDYIYPKWYEGCYFASIINFGSKHAVVKQLLTTSGICGPFQLIVLLLNKVQELFINNKLVLNVQRSRIIVKKVKSKLGEIWANSIFYFRNQDSIQEGLTKTLH